jgi:acyl-CoA thioesterase
MGKIAKFIVPHSRSLVLMTSYLDRIRREGRSANPFFCLMGIDVVHAEEGSAELRMAVRPDMHNGVGWLQGGIFTALADEAIALALYPMLSSQEGIATISESTTFIRGARDGILHATGRVIKKGRRVAFAEGNVYADDLEKTLLSRTTAAFAITSLKSGE